MGLIRLGSKPPLAVTPDVTVLDAVHAMTERHVGAAAVVDDGQVVGVFTERDLMRRVVAVDKDPRRTRVREVMTSPVISVRDETTVEAAAELMRTHHVRHLVVVGERGELHAMLALRYVLYEMMDGLERKADELTSVIMADAPGG
jgi:CBS domain-containing protein